MSARSARLLFAAATIGTLCCVACAAQDAQQASQLVQQAKGLTLSDERIRVLRQSIALQPTFSGCLMLGETLAKERQFAEAETLLLQAIGLGRDKPQRYAISSYRLAGTYRDDGKLEEAVYWYRQSVQAYPTDEAQKDLVDIELKLAEQPVGSKSIVEALTRSARGARIDPSDTEPVDTVNLHINFAFNRADLTEDGSAQANELGKALTSAELSGKRFRMIGHTDLVGKADYNQKLSERRAEAVAKYLALEWHISEALMETTGKGMSEPLYNSTADDKSKLNRRVVVQVVP